MNWCGAKALGCLAWLGGLAVMGPALAGEEGLEMTVMSLNIRYANPDDGKNRWGARRDLVAELIRREDPDAVGLQEALWRQLQDLERALPHLGRIGEGRDGGRKGEFAAILYRQDRFRVDGSGTFWLSATPDRPSITWGNACVRICTWARLVERDSGRAFYLYNTHLDHKSQRSREKSVQLLVQRMAERRHPDPVVLTGDFNAGERNPAIAFLTTDQESPVVFRDSFRTLHPDATEVGTLNGFEGKRSGARIDYVFVPPGTRVKAAAIVRDSRDGRFPSDHFPVTARFVLGKKSVPDGHPAR